MMPRDSLLDTSKSSLFQDKKNVAIFVLALALILVGAFLIGTLQPRNNKDSGQQVASSGQFIIPEAWIKEHFKELAFESPEVGGLNGDPDDDGLSNYQEYKNQTVPTKPDTDDDGTPDGSEVALGTDPLAGDPAAAIRNEQDVRDLIYGIRDEIAVEDESLGQEMEKMLDLNRPLSVPQLSDSEIKIVPASSQAALAYQQGLTAALGDYNSGRIADQFGLLFAGGSSQQVAATYAIVDKTLAELRALPVPSDLKQDLKNQIIFFLSMRNIISAQEYMIAHPEDIAKWGDIIYQARIMAAVGGEGEGEL
ncbi:MAG: hypothetical protein HY397_03110 [Candidatus Doudnabacteria bacterium]|nr:hypothetical protein [Candidatus Doudnabacteria bacterium]